MGGSGSVPGEGNAVFHILVLLYARPIATKNLAPPRESSSLTHLLGVRRRLRCSETLNPKV
jgi:hypothetical protein